MVEGTVTFAEAAKSYMARGGEAKYFTRLIDLIGDRLVNSITPGEISLLAFDIYPKAKNSTRNRHVLTPARAVLSHAHDMGWCSNLRIRALRKEPARRPPPPDYAWLLRFVDQCESDGLFRLAALVLFMNHTGARISETIALLGEHVDLESRTALLMKTKTELMATRFLSEELVERIGEIGLVPGRRVFDYNNRHSVNERLKAVAGRAGIPYKPCHTVGRGAFASNALKMGLDIRTAMDAGGWRTARLFLEVYAHTTDAGRTVASSVDAHFPRRRRRAPKTADEE